MRPWLSFFSLLLLRARAYDSNSVVQDIKDPEFIFECVEIHNWLRTQLEPPGANLKFITWDEALAKSARAWTKKCIPQNNPYLEDMKKSHPVFSGLGENRWTGHDNEYTATIAIKSWFHENRFYNYENNSCTDECSHYIQMAWDDAYKIGCAAAECPEIENISNAVHFTCYYVLSGNLGRRPYKTGRFCTQCEAGDKCFDLLCGNNERDKIKHYPFWYPSWEVPRPIMCDPLCLFTLLFRLGVFLVNVMIVFVLQYKFPNIQLEKDLLLTDLWSMHSEKSAASVTGKPKSNTPQEKVKKRAKGLKKGPH